jgi:hypothetical protein
MLFLLFVFISSLLCLFPSPGIRAKVSKIEVFQKVFKEIRIIQQVVYNKQWQLEAELSQTHKFPNSMEKIMITGKSQ